MKKNIKSIAGNFYYLFHELYLFRRDSIFLPFLGSACHIVLALITIWIPKIILDRINSNADFADLFLWIMITGSVFLLVSSVDAVAHNGIASCSQVFLFTRLKSKWEEKMMDLDYEKFISHKGKISAEKARNAINSPNYGVVAYSARVTELLECMGGFLAMGTIIFMLHPLILLLLFIMFGIELWYGAHAETRKHLLQEERAKANRKLNYIAYHTRGLKEGKDIRVYSMVPWLRSMAEEAVTEKDNVEEKTARYDLGKMFLDGLFICLRNGCAYAYLVYQYFYGSMTIGDFTLYFSAITSLGTFLGKLTQGYAGFMEADNYVADFRQFVEMDNYVTDFRQFVGIDGHVTDFRQSMEADDCVADFLQFMEKDNYATDSRQFADTDNYMTDLRQVVKLEVGKNKKKYSTDMLTKPVSFTWENVSYFYKQEDEKGRITENQVLKKINLTIKPGEKLAIVGENGAGKTTFVKLLCGLLKPKEGTISVNGMDMTDFEPEDYRNLFSAVFQKSGVLPVSIRDNIALNIFDDSVPEKQTQLEPKGKSEEKPGDKAVWRCLHLANLEKKVHSLPEGLDTHLVKRIAEHGTELSGGELQRLLLARALYKDAPVLILDEPTAALDPIAENEIYQAYHKLTEGKTSVFISHRLASTRFCDRILVMENGEIVEAGTHDELMAQRGKYAEMFQVQSQYYATQSGGKTAQADLNSVMAESV